MTTEVDAELDIPVLEEIDADADLSPVAVSRPRGRPPGSKKKKQQAKGKDTTEKPAKADKKKEELEATKLALFVGFSMLGNTLAGITRVEEVAFSAEETNQLVDLWAPIVPNMPPLMVAIVGSVMIVGGKFLIIRQVHADRKAGKIAAPSNGAAPSIAT